ncbi:MAG: AFG1 family ATPase [Burkholderiales bacterium]|nr:AFG1 family ATPase [Burkholderiales bacterium]ODU67453.1 MAG: cell division protein ZapE [Lautropia sp. SCN 66-9]
MTVVEAYERALAERGYQADAAQRAAIERLQRMFDDFVEFKARRSNRFKKLISRPPVPRGIWLYGGVGRGKSFLMDCFYASVPVVRKTRLHFHEFMRSVHRSLEELKGRPDPLDAVAAQVARRYRLICFDEFHVSDIADAMILERLMRGLFAHGVTFVMTSNYHPDQLYPDGLHRERVLPAIALINANVDVLNVDAGVDYRRQTLASVRAYLTPPSTENDRLLRDTFAALAEVKDEDPRLLIEHREIRALRRAGGVVWFDFRTLCGGPRSQNDYLEIASQFHTVILSGVPRMSAAMSSEARRFVWLVDVLYDRRVKLIISAECPPEQLYTDGAMANEFHRTVSRIVEMQSREYLEAPRREAGVGLDGRA